jgi:hypothetical protein
MRGRSGSKLLKPPALYEELHVKWKRARNKV